MTRLTATGRYSLQWYEQRANYSTSTLGINYPWINNHQGGESVNYLISGTYNTTIVENDLTLIASLGITRIRAWGQLEAVMSWNGTAFSWNASSQANLDDFLTRCNNHGLSVILVIGDGKSSGGNTSLDGKFRWSFVTGSNTAYVMALQTFVTYYKAHPNILMWEMQNEPYANLTFSANAQSSGATQTQVHTFLAACYTAVKAIVGTALVGLSDYEEDQQTQYQMFSSATNRANLIDDCTDVYSMHIYRKDQSQVVDFRTLTSKPKWCSEVGSYNYSDPTASGHPILAYNELVSDGANGFSGISNSFSTRSISAKLVNSGFTLVMPWALCDNNSMVIHLSDGSHLIGPLSRWMQAQFTSVRGTANSRLNA